MDFFCTLYPVRCFSCGRPLAHLETEYQGYLEKYRSEEQDNAIELALNDLELDTPCCRNWMMNPVYHPYNMENRTVIDGQESIMSLGKTTPSLAEILNHKTLSNQKCDSNIPTGVLGLDFKKILEFIQQNGVTVKPNTEKSPKPVIKGDDDKFMKTSKSNKDLLDISELKNIQESLQEYDSQNSTFVIPDTIGVPKINEQTKDLNVRMISIGSNDYVPLLYGRTYLCR